MMKAQFMSLWDGLDTDHYCQVRARHGFVRLWPQLCELCVCVCVR